MYHLVLHLPKYRLSMQFKLAKKRKSSSDEPFLPSKKILNLKYRVGGMTHKLFRYIFEHKKVKAILGTNIALMLVASSFIPANAIGNDFQNQNLVSIDVTKTSLTTEIGTQFPTKSVLITQNFGLFHTGIDLDGITGDPIKPIKKGKVIDISRSKFAYGNSVIIDHGDKITSLYAHLSKIEVNLGDEVTTDTEIGLMGSTGHSTGDHLHLEFRDHGIPINPLSVLR